MDTSGKFPYWKYRKEGYLAFEEWHDVEVLFSLRGKRETFLKHLTRELDVVTIQQIHSNQVLVVTKPGDYQGDGLLTDKSQLYLTISTADCLPIYICDMNKRVVGLLHAGKRGTQQLILKKAISLLANRFNSNPMDISLLFGPSICPACYDYDIWGNNQKQAEEMGIFNIINPKICTAENLDLFYSYRKEKGTQDRMIAAIKLK